MKIPERGRLLRIFIGDADRWHGRPLVDAIVEEARRQGLAGATAFRGVLGYGANSRIHSTKILRLSDDLPVMIEIVDAAEKIESFLPTVEEMVGEGLVTVEEVRVAVYRHGGGTTD